MVRISLFSRRNRNTMASTARLFVLLAIAVPILAGTDKLPYEFPPGHEQGNHIHAVLQRIRDSCPPFGHPDNKFNVTVLGTISPKIGGCASMEPPNYDVVPSFNLWLGSPKTGGGNCDEKNMDHYIFDCMSKHPFFTEEDTLGGWYVMLYDRGTRWTGSQDYRCALYETVKEDPPIIQMVISGNQSCKGLSKRMKKSEHTISKGFRQFADGSIALLFSRDLPPTPVLRKKRSEEQGRGCRFPDWSQGSWTDLKVDESLIRYEPAFHDKYDFDYGQENDDGKDGDPENTGGEHYMQRSQRHAPVGISHSSSHDSRIHRGRRSIPYINTVKMFQTSPVQNNILDGDSIKHQSSVFPDQPKPLSNTNMQFPESVKSSSRFDYKGTTTTGPQNYPKDLNKSSYEWDIVLDQLRQIKDLGNQHDDYKDTTTTGPQNYPKDLNKSSYEWDIVLDQLRQIKDLGNQHDDYKDTTTTGPQNYPKDMNKSSFEWDIVLDQLRQIKDLGNQHDDYKDTTTTGPQNYPKDMNKSSYEWDIVLDQLRQIKDLGNQHDDYKDTTTTGPQNYPKDLNKSSFEWNIVLDQLRQIKDLGNQHDDYKDTTTTGPQNYPKDMNKSSYEWDIVLDQLRQIKDLGNQHDDYKDTTTTGPQNYPKDMNKSSFEWDIVLDQLRQIKDLGNQHDDYKDTTTTGPQNYPKDMNKNSFEWNFILEQLRQTKDLGNQHDDSEKKTNNEKKRCFCDTDFDFFTSKNDRDKMELLNKLNKYSSTQKYPENLEEKSMYPFELRKKRELGDQDVKDRQKINYSDRNVKPYTPGDINIPIILDEKNTFSAKKKTTNSNKKFYPFDYVQRNKRNLRYLLNYGEEEIDSKKKECYCYSDSEGFSPKNSTFIKKVIDVLIKYLPRPKKYPEEVKEESNNPLNIIEVRKKRELGDQDNHDTEGIRKKKCVWSEAKTTTTERYRDLNFEYPYRGEPRDPSDKPEVYFGTTQDPRIYYPRKSRSIIVDKVKEDDEEKALKKNKIADELSSITRWWNIMRAIEYLRNSSTSQSIGDTKYNEYDRTPITDSVRYLKNSEAHGVPYKKALLNWRTMEREYRQWISEILYTAFPGQNHPDIIMRDFDQTFDGIEYDFDPMHPEGTADDPTAYRALTLPGGYQIEPRLSRRTTFEQKQSSDSPESAMQFGPIHVVDIDDRTDQGNTQSLNQRRRRRSIQQNQQQHATTSFTWRCEMAVDNDVKQLPQFENGAKFLTYGGRVVENNEMTGNDQQNEQDSKMTYGCLWLVPRGPNILEFSIIGTGIPTKNQSMQTFARQLCNENQAHGKDTGARNMKNLRLRRPSWVTETRTDDKKRVPVRCPVPPGIVFYGVVPAPPPPSTISTNKDQITPLRLCAKLVSSADDCTAGQMGPADQMKYTVSECVEQDSSTSISQTEIAQQTIFEEREYQCIGQWTEPQEHFSPVAGEKPVMLTYTYLKRLSPVSKEGAQYECFVGTPIPNDEGVNPETTTTILLTEAGTNTECSRLQDPYRSGMKLVGTKIKKEGACKGSAQPVQDTTGGSWYSLKPQSISPSIPGAENGGGAWYAAPPVPVIAAQGPTTMTPILTGRHTGGNGATFTSRHNKQNGHPQSANLPPKTNHSFRTVADKRIVILAVILFTARRFFN